MFIAAAKQLVSLGFDYLLYSFKIQFKMSMTSVQMANEGVKDIEIRVIFAMKAF